MDSLEYYRQMAAKVIREIGSLSYEPLFFAELVAIRLFARFHEEDGDVVHEAITRMQAYLGYQADLAGIIQGCIDDADLYVQFILDVEKDQENP